MFIVVVRRDIDRAVIDVFEYASYTTACDVAMKLTTAKHTATVYKPA